MDRNKMDKLNKLKDAVLDRMAQIDPDDIGKPSVLEYGKNLASFHCKLCEAIESEEGKEYGGASAQAMRGTYRDGPEWGAYRRGRNAMGQFTSYGDGYSEADMRGYSMGGSMKERLRMLMDDPDARPEERAALKRAYEAMR